MDVVFDRWLAGIFGQSVFKVVLSADTAQSETLELARRPAEGFYYAKVDTSRVDQLRALTRAGFYVVDVNITLKFQAAPTAHPMRTFISEPRHDEESAVLDIAERCFRYSRFHLDPSIAPSLANRIKREWIANYFRKERGEALYVARDDSGPTGFLAVLCSSSENGTVRVIDLVGVHPERQHSGIGRALVDHFIQTHAARSAGLEVGTQAANVPSLKLYQQMGFVICRSQYVLHRHVPN